MRKTLYEKLEAVYLDFNMRHGALKVLVEEAKAENRFDSAMRYQLKLEELKNAIDEIGAILLSEGLRAKKQNKACHGEAARLVKDVTRP